jgi:hypothetical protein
LRGKCSILYAAVAMTGEKVLNHSKKNPKIVWCRWVAREAKRGGGKAHGDYDRENEKEGGVETARRRC